MPQIFGFCFSDIARLDMPAHILHLLDSPRGYSPALCLLSHFTEISSSIDLAEVIRKLVRGKSLNKSVSWLKTLDSSWHDAFIQQCLANDELKMAWDAVKAFNLDQSYSEVGKMYKKQRIDELGRKDCWGRAAFVAGSDTDLQVEKPLLWFNATILST